MSPDISSSAVKYRSALSGEVCARVLSLALNNASGFSASGTYGDNKGPVGGHAHRHSVSLKRELFLQVAPVFEQLVHELMAEVCKGLDLAPFPIASIDLGMTAHNDGDYYLWHQDEYSEQGNPRIISFVYYFHKMPRAFSGGELGLYPKNQPAEIIMPENNLLVFFRSTELHEVKKVSNAGGVFENSRFSVHGFIRRAGS
jgi:Rps23 Pro-64 3,4-dihydroxylase Tpa1-like proline 4-hydroxylase